MNKPFLLRPSGKDYLWGGNRLNEEYGKNIDMSPLAETWECSTHLDGPSYVASGEFEGMTLKDVLIMHPDYLGKYSNQNGELPVLIKLIDANKDLSVQVHPTDEYAIEHENGQLGKTEMWYVLDAKENAQLIYGLKHNLNPDILIKALQNEAIEKYFNKMSVKKNDVFFIEAGTIHAIGAGSLIAEIQENSNLTYRLYDYNRMDKDGKKRELHIDKALQVANLNKTEIPNQKGRIQQYEPGLAKELLARCKYFETHRLIINTRENQFVDFETNRFSYEVFLCIEGSGSIGFQSDDSELVGSECEQLSVSKGDCIFTPAGCSNLRMHGKMQLLDMKG